MATTLQVNASTQQAVGAFNALAAAISNTTNQFNAMNAAMNHGNGAATRYAGSITAINSVFSNLMSVVNGAFNAIRTLGAGVGFAFNSIIKELDKLQGFNAIMSVSTKNAEDVASSYNFLRKTADRLGVQFDVLTTNYAKLVAALPPGLDGLRTAEKVFMGIAMAARTMHASNSDTQLMFYAITQMASKGKVSMEELRRQLGEKLPGVIQIAAKALNTLPEELENAIRKGIVSSEKFLPIFGDALIRTFADSSEKASSSVSASIARLTNVWVDFVKHILDSGAGQAIVGVFDALREKLSDPYLIERFALLIKDLSDRFTEFIRNITADDLRNGFDTATTAINMMVTVIGKLIEGITWIINNSAKAGAIIGGLGGAAIGALGGPIGAGIGLIGGAAAGAYAGSQLAPSAAQLQNRSASNAAADQAASVSRQERELLKFNQLIPLLQQFKGLDTTRGLENLFKAENLNTKTLSDLNRILSGNEFKNAKDRAQGVRDYAKYGVVVGPQTAKLSDVFTAATKKAGRISAEERSLQSSEFRALGLNPNILTEMNNYEKLLKSGKLSQEQYNEAIYDLMAKQPVMIEHKKAEADAMKAAQTAASAYFAAQEQGIQWARELADSEAARTKSMQDAEGQVNDRVTALKDEAAIQELSELRNISLAQALALVTLRRMEDSRAALVNDPEMLASLNRQIDSQRELSELIGSRDIADANRRAAEDAALAWQNAFQDVGDTLVDIIMDGGKTAADQLEQLFKRLVLRPIMQSVVNQGLGAVAGFLGGEGGTDAQGNPVMTGLSAASSLNTLYGYGQKAYGWATGVGTASGVTYGSSATIGGTVAQSSATKAALYGAEGYGSSVGAAGTASGGSASTASSGMGVYALYAAIAIKSYQQAQKDWAEGFRREQSSEVMRENLGLLRPIFGAQNIIDTVWRKLGVSDKTAALLSGSSHAARIFGRSSPQVEAQGVSGTLTGGSFEGGQAFADIRQRGGWLRSDKRWTEFAEMPEEIGRMLSTAAKTVFDESKKFGDALGLPADQLSTVSQDIKVALVQATDDTPEAIETANKANFEALNAVLNSYGDALVASYAEAIRPLANYGETTAETIKRVGTSIVGVNAVLATLGIASLQASIDGGKAALALESMFDGISGLQQAAAGYLQAYYTDAERANLTTTALSKSLGEVGLTLPTTREGFRDLVEAQDLSTESGRNAFAMLMSVASAFDQVQQSAEAMASELADAIAQALPKLGRAPDPYTSIQGQLAGTGVSLSLSQLMGASQDDIYAFAEAFLLMADASHESKLTVVNAAGALGELREEAEGLALDLNLELLRATGREQAAVNIEREQELSALRLLDPALASVKSSIYAAIDAAAQAARIESLLSGVDDVASDFLSGSDLTNYMAERIQGILAAGGIDASIGSILGATTGQIRELWDVVGIDGREAILAAYGPFKELDELLHGLGRRVSEYRTDTLADNIENARLGTLTPQARIAALKSTEAGLFEQLATSEDPIGVAERLQGVILQRIGEEATLREQLANKTRDSLNEQLDAAKRLIGLSQEIGQFTGTLAFSDLSPLSRRNQVGAAESLFETTLDRARGGDEFARSNLIGNARAYLEEAVSAFASGPQSAAIYNRVTSALDEFGLSASTEATPQIAALQAQIDNLPTIAKNSTDMLAALLRIDSVLDNRDGTASLATQVTLTDVPSTQGSTGPSASQEQAAQITQLTVMVADATRTANNTAALLAATQEGFTQAIAELRTANAQRASLLTEMQVGPVPA